MLFLRVSSREYRIDGSHKIRVVQIKGKQVRLGIEALKTPKSIVKKSI